MNVPYQRCLQHARRLERVLERFFKSSRRPRQDVVVCHGNLIRALVLRVASGRADGWHRLMIHHASITSFRISKKREVTVVGFNQVEHLSLPLRSES
jgi:serine/threonine-protein phosphatase PGAM5